MDYARSEELWERIKKDFRRACHLRHDGDEEAAAVILKGSLPEQIAAWAEAASTFSAEEQRLRLEKLFADEVRRTEDAWAVAERIGAVIADKVAAVQCSDTASLRGEIGELREELQQMRRELARLRKERASLRSTAPAVSADPTTSAGSADPTTSAGSAASAARKRRPRLAVAAASIGQET